jgi:hypothetical protein
MIHELLERAASRAIGSAPEACAGNPAQPGADRAEILLIFEAFVASVISSLPSVYRRLEIFKMLFLNGLRRILIAGP